MSKLGVVMMLVSAFWLARSRHGVKLLNLISRIFATYRYVEKGLFSLRGTAEVRLNFSFSLGRSFSGQACVASTSCQGLLGISALFGCILFYLFSFCLSTTTFLVGSKICWQNVKNSFIIIIITSNGPNLDFLSE